MGGLEEGFLNICFGSLGGNVFFIGFGFKYFLGFVFNFLGIFGYSFFLGEVKVVSVVVVFFLS